jgi:concanavalin A-like lectin/glucanase superfamily protein
MRHGSDSPVAFFGVSSLVGVLLFLVPNVAASEASGKAAQSGSLMPAASALATTDSCVSPPQQMVSWWAGDGNANDIQDSNNGTLQGGAAFGAGKVGLAFDLNGNNQYALIPNSASLQPQQLTVDAWVYVRSLADFDPLGSDVIFSKDLTSTDGISYALLASRPGLPPNTRLPCDPEAAGCFFAVVAPTNGGLPALSAVGSSFGFNQWYHVAMTWDGSAVALYVDGNLILSLPVLPDTISYDSNNAAIGRHSTGGGSFDGRIDEVELFNRALSASEIQSIFNAGSAGKCKPTPPNACPLTQGFWKKHPSSWPATSLSLGSQTYTQAELLVILNTPSGGDASLALADQLIAAELNIANGSDPAPVSATIADAEALLSTFSGKLPYNVKPSSVTGNAMLSLAATLEQYNSGLLTPTCGP